jgi:general secretion pathway protein E
LFYFRRFADLCIAQLPFGNWMTELSVAETGVSAGDSDQFAAFLVQRGLLTEGALERARRSAAQTQERLVPVLSKLGLLAERELVTQLSSFYKAPIASGADFPQKPVFAELNWRFLAHRHIVPLSENDGGLVAAMADPGDDGAARALQLFAGRPIGRRVAALTDIETAIRRLYGNSGPASGTDEALPEEAASDDIDRLADLASEAPVIRMVHSLVTAVEAGASDIHIEPFVDRVSIRFRLDGLLREVRTEPPQLGAAIASRVKIMAHLNIAERRLAQDGRLSFTVRGKEVDVRVSTSPTLHGESVVLRIPDRGSIALDFEALGFDDEVLKPLQRHLQRPHGIILSTGPTGSGKTTTLYAALLALNQPDRKILTIEDPVEYQLDRINQQAVQPQIGRSFAAALRSFLRQDPDIIMVGEIRDGETAQIAVQAALTGHLILSTLHTNDAASAMTRLLDMGVEDYLLTSTVNAVMGQRLVRRLCAQCRQPHTLSADESFKIFGTAPGKPATLYRAVGCQACHGTGYRGRTTIVELLEMTAPIRRLVLQKAEAQDIQRAAVAQGMRTMFRHGIAKALAGTTSLEEVLRVTQEA